MSAQLVGMLKPEVIAIQSLKCNTNRQRGALTYRLTLIPKRMPQDKMPT